MRAHLLEREGEAAPYASVSLRLSTTDETAVSPALNALAADFAGAVAIGSYPVRARIARHTQMFLRSRILHTYKDEEGLMSSCAIFVCLACFCDQASGLTLSEVYERNRRPYPVTGVHSISCGHTLQLISCHITYKSKLTLGSDTKNNLSSYPLEFSWHLHTPHTLADEASRR